MRTENSAKNISINFLNNLLLNILRFVSRTIFIKIMGELYLGVNGILSNVLGILALADLGIGNAISFSLYKPLADKNTEKVKSLMKFYKKAYSIIGIIVLVAGLCLFPFLGFFIKDNQGISGLNIYYLVFLTNMVISYFFSYKRTLITADQHEYKITPIIMIFNTLITIIQIAVIFIYKNYLIYLLVQTVFTLLENIFINRFIDKEYPYVKDNNYDKISKEELKPIKTNVKALMYHKLGTYFVDSTDNIIISKFLGLSFVGLYSNYYLIINMLNTFITSALRSITSSFGNVNAKETPQRRHEIFKTVNFINFVVFSICAVCLYNLFNLFIGKIWIGEKFLIDNNTVLVLCIVFFVNGFMYINDIVKGSAGIYDKDKFVPIIQSIINIVLSVILVKKMGLVGVFLGTLASTLFVMMIKPYIIYKYVFNKKVWGYYLDFIIKVIVFALGMLISNYIISFNFITNKYLAFILYGLISVVVMIGLIVIFFSRNYEYKDALQRFKFIKNKVIRKE